jgi:hypothetical protein
MIYTAGPVRNAFEVSSTHCEGKYGGGWALKIGTFLGPVNWHRADRRVPFGAQKSQDSRTQPPSHLPK